MVTWKIMYPVAMEMRSMQLDSIITSRREVVTHTSYCDPHCAVVIKDTIITAWFSQSYY